MNAPRDPDRLIHAFLQEGQTELADPVFDTVRATIEHKRQRTVIGPWRMPDIMNRYVPIGLGAAAVVVALVVGTQVLAQPGPSGAGAAPSPTAAPSASAAGQSTPSPNPPPPLSESFTSTLHAFSASYPEGWIAQTATEPWTDGTFSLSFDGPQADFLYDPIRKSELFLTIASQPIGDSTPEEWMAAQMASGEGCGTTTEPITIDGATGLIGGTACDVAVVTSGGRGYWIQLYTGGDDAIANAPYDRAWFESVLATVQLRPEDAGAPPAGPFTFADNGQAITVNIPSTGWTFDSQFSALGKGDEVNNMPEAVLLSWAWPAGTEFDVYGDPCHWASTRPDAPATSVEDFAAALAAQPSRNASAPVDVTIGGYAGKSVTLHVPDDIDFSQSSPCDQDNFASYGVAGDPGPSRYHQGPGQIDELWILDVDGATVVLDATYRQDSRAELVEELRAIAQSATFK